MRFTVDSGKAGAMQVMLTPLIDCIFLLLIFFLYSRFRTPEGELNAHLPRESGVVTSAQQVEEARRRQVLVEVEGSKSGPVVVRVDKEEVHVDPKEGPQKVEQALGGLVSILATRRKEQAGCFVILKPTEGAPFGVVLACFDSARQAGIKDVSFAPPGKEGI